MTARKLRAILLPIAAVLIVLVLVVSILAAVFGDALTLLLSSTGASSATRAKGETLATQIEEEGIVMVKNSDDVLPLGDFDKVNVFGWSSTQWIMGGSGSGRALDSDHNNALTPNTDLLKALTNAGIEYNTELTNMYTRFLNNRPFWSQGALHTHSYQFSRLFEPAITDANYYTDSLLSNAKNYSDIAFVVLGRVTGESNDCPTVQYKNVTTSGVPTGANVDETRTYLDISTEEEALLKYVGENYDKVVVIINSTNAMNLGFLRDIDGLDACLIVGGTGNNAANAIPSILRGYKMVAEVDEDGNEVKDANGETVMKKVLVSPSGRTTDTYVFDFHTNSSFANCSTAGVGIYNNTAGSGLYPTTTQYPNADDGDRSYPGVLYLDYAEGIYVGYKWYETADAEGYWADKGGYDSVVQFPFGYGLSYTEFSWAVKSIEPAAGANLTADGEIQITVNVKNIGEYPGQDVVQAYITVPYEQGGIEKSYVTLVAFAKTQEAIQPGESQDVTLKFKVEDMASYDYSEKKVIGGGYILEAGNYEVKLMKNSHELGDVTVGNAVTTYHVANDILYPENSANGAEVHNLFGADSSDGFAADGSDSGQNITYLSRANFAGTFPTKQANRDMSAALRAANMYTQADATAWDNAHSNATMPTTGAANGNVIWDASGNITDLGYQLGDPDNYDNEELWASVLDNLTLTELQRVVLHGYLQETGNNALTSVGVRRSSNGSALNSSVDGPAQVGSFNRVNAGTGFPNPTVIAQTWNTELSQSFGLAVGAEALEMGYTGWYAPGINLHRSAFGGRNFEYYSEDAYLTGQIGAATIRGCLNAGTYLIVKHLIGYDQDSYRDGIYCWMTEQALREVYLKPFKIVIDEGGLTGIMTSYGRLGAVWAGGSEALLNDLLRKEWGFKGMVLTDYSDHQDFMNGDQMLRNGGDVWMDGYQNNGNFRYGSTSAALVTEMRRAVKNSLYMRANAEWTAKNYDPAGDKISIVTGGADGSWWVGVLVAVDVVLGLAAAALIVIALLKKDKKGSATAQKA